MKTIIIGPSLAGKSTLIRYLRVKYPNLNISEIDQELTDLNGGEYPSDTEYKHNVLAAKIIKEVLEKDIFFFTNTDYFTIEDLKLAKQKGFKIIQLDLSLEKLKERNAKRVIEEGYYDMTEYLEGMLDYQQKVFESGVVDLVVKADQEVEKIAEIIVS